MEPRDAERIIRPAVPVSRRGAQYRRSPTSQLEETTRSGTAKMRLSPRINKEQRETFNRDMMREYMRACRVRYETARERLMKAIGMMEEWKEQVRMELHRDVQEHNITILTQLLMDNDQEYSQQEQARERQEQRRKRQE